MGDNNRWGWPPTGAPLYTEKDDHWTQFDNSVNAVSFGFVATAILISMFLVMAIFERFLRPTSPPALTAAGDRRNIDIESQMSYNAKCGHLTPKVPVQAKEVSVLMPGEHIPTFIAHPAPVPFPPERFPWPSHHHILLPKFASNLNGNSTSSST